MYENITFENIMERVLARIPSTMDKREGSVIYDAIAPAAIELQNMYVELDTVLNETFADTASLYYLKKRAAERGISQILATNAILQGEFTPTTLELDIGTRFSCDDLNYIISEKVSDGVYQLMCETEGTEGNVHLGTLIPIDYIGGLETATLTEVLIPAVDDETVDHLRERYFTSMTSQAFGGNIADYKEKVKSLPNLPVAGVKLTPVWNGGGTVKITITDGNFNVPSEEFVDAVQNETDPIGHQGQGVGFAPIGHIVTVVGVQSETVNIATNITYQQGWDWDASKNYIQNAIDEYFHELRAVWDENENLIVRISQLESRILACEGVLDISGTTLNGSDANLSLASDAIPIRGTVNGN